MEFKTNEKGELVLTEQELKDFAEEVAKTQTDKMVKEFKLDQPAPPPFAPKVADPAPDFMAKAGEDTYQKHNRLVQAETSVKLGKLAVLDAPKEVKFAHWAAALASRDGAKAAEIANWGWDRQKVLNVTTAAEGGNLVPIEFATDLKVAMETYGSIQDCTRHDMATNELDLRTVTTKPTIYQVNELTAPTEAAPEFGKPQLICKAFAGLQVISKELFQDNNVGLYDKLLALFAEQFAKRMDHELFVGTSFTGVFGSVTTDTTMAGTDPKNITYKSLVDLSVSLSPGQLVGGGKFYMHRVLWGYIQGIEDLNGRPIVMNPWDAKARTLLGFPVVLNEVMPYAAAAATDYIAFGNLQWVDFGMRQEIEAQFLTEATVASTNLAEKRAYGLIIDTRWGLVVSIAANLAVLKTAAA